MRSLLLVGKVGELCFGLFRETQIENSTMIKSPTSLKNQHSLDNFRSFQILYVIEKLTSKTRSRGQFESKITIQATRISTRT